MAKIRMTVKKVGTSQQWEEEYATPAGADPTEYAENLIAKYNATLRPAEVARELLGVEILDVDAKPPEKHRWEKQNLYTVVSRGMSYDIHKCTVCGITGKRYGFNDVKRDPKYKAKKYEHCTSVK